MQRQLNAAREKDPAEVVAAAEVAIVLSVDGTNHPSDNRNQPRNITRNQHEDGASPSHPYHDRPVIYADDDENDRFLMQRAFEKVGIPNELCIASDGQAALEVINGALATGRSDAIPQLILLDLKMPRVSGLEALRRIRHEPRLAAIPVVILTSSVQDRDTREALALGADAYLVKAPAFSALTNTVAELRDVFLVGASTPRPVLLRGNRLPPA